MCEIPPLDDRDVDRTVDHKLVKKSTQMIPRLPNFLTQVLYSITTIRRKRGRGATLGEICRFLKLKFGVTGDIQSRVETTIEKATSDGFILEKDGKHILVTPLARMQNAKTRREKHCAIRLMQKIFLYKPNMRRPRCPTRQSEAVRIHRDVSTAMSPVRVKTVSKSAVVTVLKHIETVLMTHLTAPENLDEKPLSLCTLKEPRPEEDLLKKSDLNINRLFCLHCPNKNKEIEPKKNSKECGGRKQEKPAGIPCKSGKPGKPDIPAKPGIPGKPSKADKRIKADSDNSKDSTNSSDSSNISLKCK